MVATLEKNDETKGLKRRTGEELVIEVIEQP